MSSSRLGQGENVAGGLVESHVMAEQVRHKRYEKQQRCGLLTVCVYVEFVHWPEFVHSRMRSMQ